MSDYKTIEINNKLFFIIPEKYVLADGIWKDGYILRPCDYPEEKGVEIKNE